MKTQLQQDLQQLKDNGLRETGIYFIEFYIDMGISTRQVSIQLI